MAVPDVTELEFRLEEPPSMPQQTLSGKAINPIVVRALEASHETFRRANDAVDRLVNAVRGKPSFPPPRPGNGGYHR
jgi:hypothetical protein